MSVMRSRRTWPSASLVIPIQHPRTRADTPLPPRRCWLKRWSSLLQKRRNSSERADEIRACLQHAPNAAAHADVTLDVHRSALRKDKWIARGIFRCALNFLKRAALYDK